MNDSTIRTVQPYRCAGCGVRGAVMSDLDNRRAEIATRLLAGLLANPGGPVQRRADTGWGFINCAPAEVAEAAVALADDLIAALAGNEEGEQ